MVEPKIVDPSPFTAIISEWRVVIAAMKAYKEQLDNTTVDDEIKQLLIDDEIQRLDMLIPDFEMQFRANYPGVI